MKKLSYNGPTGPVEIKEPLPLRLVNSAAFLLFWTVVLIAAAGYYLSFQHPPALLGKPLSPGHKKLESNCFHCHTPFRPVSDDSCLQPDCHGLLEEKKTHASMSCRQCHPMHTDGVFLPESMPAEECKKCHEELAADPNSPFHPGAKARRPSTRVAYTIFNHNLHSGLGRTKRGQKKYACWQCHYIGPKTLNIPMENLFQMGSCLECKYHADKAGRCQECHNYGNFKWSFHLPKAETPRRTCIKEEELRDLKLRSLREHIPSDVEPGWKNLPLCETGAPSVPGAKTPAPSPLPSP